MARAKRKKREADLGPMLPTPEQMAKGEFVQGGNLATGLNERAGLAYRRVPVLVTLANTGKLTQRQFDGLWRYREIAVAADRSELRSCCDFSVGGGGEGLPHFGVRMNIELGRLERALGSRCALARAVAVDDLTPSQWAMRQAGSLMRWRAHGLRVVTWFEPHRAALDNAMADIRKAGDQLAAALAF